MAIALTNISGQYGVPSEGSGKQPVLVPPAAVWEPAQRRPLGSTRESGVRDVRTLESRDRTQGRTERVGDFGGSYRRSASCPRRSSSNVGNYVLGAVFGAAVFIGTVWGGLSIDSEVPNASATPTTAVVSSR